MSLFTYSYRILKLLKKSKDSILCYLGCTVDAKKWRLN